MQICTGHFVSLSPSQSSLAGWQSRRITVYAAQFNRNTFKSHLSKFKKCCFYFEKLSWKHNLRIIKEPRNIWTVNQNVHLLLWIHLLLFPQISDLKSVAKLLLQGDDVTSSSKWPIESNTVTSDFLSLQRFLCLSPVKSFILLLLFSWLNFLVKICRD